MDVQIHWCGDGCSAAGLKINDKFKSLILLQVAPCDTNRKLGPLIFLFVMGHDYCSTPWSTLRTTWSGNRLGLADIIPNDLFIIRVLHLSLVNILIRLKDMSLTTYAFKFILT